MYGQCPLTTLVAVVNEFWDKIDYWWRSIVVRTSVLAGELFLC